MAVVHSKIRRGGYRNAWWKALHLLTLSRTNNLPKAVPQCLLMAH